MGNVAFYVDSTGNRNSNDLSSRTNIFDISDDIWFLTFMFQTPWDFGSISLTCTHFHDLCDETKHPAVNKFWKYHCHKQWKQLKHTCCNAVYSCSIGSRKGYNFLKLYDRMANFIIVGMFFRGYPNLDHWYKRQIRTFMDDKSMAIPIKQLLESDIKREIIFDNLADKITNMEIRMNDLDNILKDELFRLIIAFDNVDLFSIWLCNFTARNTNFDINEPVIPNEEHMYRTPQEYRILARVVCDNASKIAAFILGNVNEMDDKKDYNYNFPKINLDISIDEAYWSTNTLLTYACSSKFVEIVSLLVNHPNMTKELINKSDGLKATPLHSAVMKGLGGYKNPQGDRDNSFKIAQMLLNDKRISDRSINGGDCDGVTPLMFAIIDYHKVAAILIDDDRCDVNIQRSSGDTVLHYLMHIVLARVVEKEDKKSTDYDMDNYLRLCEKLLQRKDLDCNIKNDKGNTALDEAKDKKLDLFVKLLNDHQQKLINVA